VIAVGSRETAAGGPTIAGGSELLARGSL